MPSRPQLLLLLPPALLALSVSVARADLLEARQTISLPAPISFAPDENWDGIDGTWSSFTLRVGTPQQFVRVFPSWAAYQTWVVLPQGCGAASDASACDMARGSTFNISQSSTWDPQGLFSLYIETNLGYTGDAQYGYDTVGLGGLGERGPTVQNMTVGGLAVEDFYLGVFGLNPAPTNFTTFNDPSPSYMTTLKEKKLIPSVSFGYTAGASYRFTGALASLTLGGYDDALYEPNNVNFTFAPNDERAIVVAIQSISTTSTGQSSTIGTQLLPTPIYAYIDTTVPHIWLPIEACQVFESEFGLVYDNTTELYLVNETLHNALLARNANVSFTLGQGTEGGATVSITLPYAAFDLTAQPPYQGLSNNTNYFPLRRAANESQYTLGRTFMQEAYLAVDWEATRFNLSQCTWSQTVQPHIVAIPPYDSTQASYAGSTQSSTSSSSVGPSKGAIAGIVIGVLAVIAIIAGLVFCFRRSRSRSMHRELESVKSDCDEPSSGPTRTQTPMSEARTNVAGETATTVFPKAELEGSLIREHYQPDSKRLPSQRSSPAPATPISPNAPSTRPSYFTNPNQSNPSSPTTPSAGVGTYSSIDGNTLASPMTPDGSRQPPGPGSISANEGTPSSTSETYSRERAVYEMPGDMPAIGEKDGRMLSEKDALKYRERKYNGVNAATRPQNSPPERVLSPRKVEPRDVVRADPTLTPLSVTPEGADYVRASRAFSFEDRSDTS